MGSHSSVPRSNLHTSLAMDAAVISPRTTSHGGVPSHSFGPQSRPPAHPCQAPHPVEPAERGDECPHLEEVEGALVAPPPGFGADGR
jgi:hypothetical protein